VVKRGSLALAFVLILCGAGFSWEKKITRVPLRNPFAPPEIIVRKPKKKVITNPLQKYDVKAFVVKGIINTDKGNLALVIAPDGSVYIVREGMFMGNKGEVIKKITSDRIILSRGNKEIVLTLGEK